jgi:excisionase family DNA binding protein
MADQTMTTLVKAIAVEVAALVREEMAQMSTTLPLIQPALMDVREAGIYLGRSEQSIQHLISDREFPVVRVGRRVHLHRPDLDNWIEKNKH